jgi:hypothetical protein
MTKIYFELSLATHDTATTLAACASAGWIPPGVPQRMKIDERSVKPTADWARGLDKAKTELTASWAPHPNTIRIIPDEIIVLRRDSVDVDPDQLADVLSGIPFEFATFGPRYAEWEDGSLAAYRPHSFGDFHAALGWGCAFKGAGHDRLVSRRWLDHGPWRAHRAPSDVSFVQFHDLDADAATAWAQALPGHVRLRDHETGGFIQRPFVYQHDLAGTYRAARRVLEIVVHGREVSPLEMLERRAACVEQKLGADKPLDNVAYVFAEEAQARAHLDELWLRGLECWAWIEGEKTRLDDQHTVPTPPPVDWA